MSSFDQEPAYHHGSPAKTGVLLVNLGTPEAPTKAAVRTYLKEFLSDPRVVEIPALLWWLILHGLVLPFRSGKSAHAYQQVWTPEGSPLLVNAARQTVRFRAELEAIAGSPVVVELGMRYGQPSIAAALQRLQAQHCTQILVFPLYPQYAASTSATAVDAVAAALRRVRRMPALRTIMHYHDHPAYIAALANSVREHWQAHGEPERLMMSFHGLPRRSLDLGDPYHCECQKTGRLLAEALDLPAERYLVAFQSRFGKAEWLKPYAAPTLEAWAKAGVKKVDVICPGFSADCLETLEEIAMGGKESFLARGGQQYRYIPALNDRDDWIAAMLTIAREHLGGWLVESSDWYQAEQQSSEENSRLRALALGAKQ